MNQQSMYIYTRLPKICISSQVKSVLASEFARHKERAIYDYIGSAEVVYPQEIHTKVKVTLKQQELKVHTIYQEDDGFTVDEKLSPPFLTNTVKFKHFKLIGNPALDSGLIRKYKGDLVLVTEVSSYYNECGEELEESDVTKLKAKYLYKSRFYHYLRRKSEQGKDRYEIDDGRYLTFTDLFEIGKFDSILVEGVYFKRGEIASASICIDAPTPLSSQPFSHPPDQN